MEMIFGIAIALLADWLWTKKTLDQELKELDQAHWGRLTYYGQKRPRQKLPIAKQHLLWKDCGD